MENFRLRFNEENYDGIGELIDPAVRHIPPFNAPDRFFSSVKAYTGNMEICDPVSVTPYATVLRGIHENCIVMYTVTVNSEGYFTLFSVYPYQQDTGAVYRKKEVTLRFPSEEEWTVRWGGDTPEQNYHLQQSVSQRHAVDLVIADENGKSFSGTNYMDNAVYFAYNSPVLSPCDGIVLRVVDGEKDNLPGFTNPYQAFGNYVMIRSTEGAYVVLAHLVPNSITVAVGTEVKSGDFLGLCGNSGNSTEPHLHIHAQDGPDLNYALGVRINFTDVRVNGEPKEGHSPVQGEKISPLPTD